MLDDPPGREFHYNTYKQNFSSTAYNRLKAHYTDRRSNGTKCSLLGVGIQAMTRVNSAELSN